MNSVASIQSVPQKASSGMSSHAAAAEGGAAGFNRTSRMAPLRLRCTERDFEGSERRPPVKLVVFDLDETLTMATFMPKVWESLPREKFPALLAYNFDTPWVEGDRLQKLKDTLSQLIEGKGRQSRSMAILTRNEAGVRPVLKLLQHAGLSEKFSAIWALPWDNTLFNGCYRTGDDWEYFNPPVNGIPDHKADVLANVAAKPASWFPQLEDKKYKDQNKEVGDLRYEEIVLVDDQRANFQNPNTGSQVLRIAKVARYEETYRHFGVLDMGGIAAHTDADLDALRRFVEDPWQYKETHEVFCLERSDQTFDTNEPVRLVIFDFDETLTLATFMPEDERCATDENWVPAEDGSPGGGPGCSAKDLVEYNFESPFCDGSRVKKLRGLFRALAQTKGKDGAWQWTRPLAILTKNEQGALAVLNLLRLAKLDSYFSAIWTIRNSRAEVPNGVFQHDGKWHSWEPPVADCYEHKADVLKHIVGNPGQWFPQLSRLLDVEPSERPRYAKAFEGLVSLKPESIVLVDDERTNFKSDHPVIETREVVIRTCKVARYDAPYRDCGPLVQLGGIGAHGDMDYSILKRFVDKPWECSFNRQIAPGKAADDMEMRGLLVRQDSNKSDLPLVEPMASPCAASPREGGFAGLTLGELGDTPMAASASRAEPATPAGTVPLPEGEPSPKNAAPKRALHRLKTGSAMLPPTPSGALGEGGAPLLAGPPFIASTATI